MSISRIMACIALGCAIFAAHADALKDADHAINRKDYPSAVRLLEPLALHGQAQAQLRLGLLYYHGHGVRESDALALAWFERAARQGLAEAQYHLGNMYAYGLAPVAPDMDVNRLAAQWYFEAARQGHAQAQYSLGILFRTGSGVEQDRAEARKWISRAAAQGHSDAQAFLRDAPAD